MTINAKPVYKRILFKLDGEALQDTEGFGVDVGILDRMTQEIEELVKLGIWVGVAIGGGSLFRGAGLAKVGVNRVVGDHMGMLATIMNGLAMRDVLRRAYVNVRLMSAIPLNDMYDSYSWVEAINLLHSNRVVILSAGTGNPFLTTDSAVCLRSIEIGVDAMLKATKIGGVFTADPTKDLTATIHEQLTYSEVLEKELEVMGSAVFTSARDHRLPIRASNMDRPGALCRMIMSEKERALITE